MSESFYCGSTGFPRAAISKDFYRRRALPPIPSRTITEAHFAAFQTLSASNHPIYYDVEDIAASAAMTATGARFPGLRFTAAGAGTFALVVGDSPVAFIEQSSKFLKPVSSRRHALPGARGRRADAATHDRVVTIAVTVHNQKDELFSDRRAKIPAAEAQT